MVTGGTSTTPSSNTQLFYDAFLPGIANVSGFFVCTYVCISLSLRFPEFDPYLWGKEVF